MKEERETLEQELFLRELQDLGITKGAGAD